ncbi:MAG: CDP-alcohol phosphatidyltransferase family protein [Kistimonas sp.]|nr:CDP-alcohol phosphatidyltransferase family protein [Kistimonas sp.]
MLDRWTQVYTQKLLKTPASCLSKYTTANTVTLVGFGMGILALPLLIQQHYAAALVMILLNRVADGLDGAIARQTSPSDAGGFLDITLDFIFYAAIVLGFAAAQPATNALAAAFLLFCFTGTGTSFLAFACMAAKNQLQPEQPPKSLYYLEGLTEGTETLLFFGAACLWPTGFPVLAWCFGALCLVTTATRLLRGYRLLKQAQPAPPGHCQ